MTRSYIRGTEADRFWPKVDKDGPVPAHAPDLGACWLWTAADHGDGYGLFKRSGAGAGLVRSHRWSWEQENGEVPDGMELDHRCRRPACVRPSHLEAVTHAENCARSVPGGRVWRSAITHCPQGHEYDEANTRIYRGSRSCRKCNNARSNLRRTRK